jgi:hypothetical protein
MRASHLTLVASDTTFRAQSPAGRASEGGAAFIRDLHALMAQARHVVAQPAQSSELRAFCEAFIERNAQAAADLGNVAWVGGRAVEAHDEEWRIEPFIGA